MMRRKSLDESSEFSAAMNALHPADVEPKDSPHSLGFPGDVESKTNQAEEKEGEEDEAAVSQNSVPALSSADSSTSKRPAASRKSAQVALQKTVPLLGKVKPPPSRSRKLEAKDEVDDDSESETSDESWSGGEQASSGHSESSDEEWSESEERKPKRNKRTATAANSAARGPQRNRPSSALQRARQQQRQHRLSAYSTPVFPPRAVQVTRANYAFEFDVQSEFSMYTVDVVVGNFVNALEGACENQGNASSLSWLNEVPPPNYTSGPIVVRPVSMRLPAMAGRWMAGHFISPQGCCGIMFWHTLYVGPNPHAAAELVKDFALHGMDVIENNEKDVLRNKGLRLIGRYSWDYYRQYGGGGFRIPQLASSLFGGPHCFFISADEYRNKIYPDILTRVTEFDNGGQDARFQPFVNKINGIGALGVFPQQEYMFAKVFLQPDSYANRTRWMGVRALLMYTYNVGESWRGCRIENAPIDIPS